MQNMNPDIGRDNHVTKISEYILSSWVVPYIHRRIDRSRQHRLVVIMSHTEPDLRVEIQQNDLSCSIGASDGSGVFGA